MRRALQDFIILGVQTNLPLHQRILDHPGFVQGDYDMEVIRQALLSGRLHLSTSAISPSPPPSPTNAASMPLRPPCPNA